MTAEAFMAACDEPFFVPNERFFDALGKRPWRWKRFVDVGAGVGRLTRLMRERGHEVHAIDRYARDAPEVADVQIADATDAFAFDFESQDCALMARPCHDGFVDAVTHNCIETGDVLYAGLERNLQRDLGDWQVETLAEHVGRDDEVLVRVLGLPASLETWDVHDAPMGYHARRFVKSVACTHDLQIYCTPEEFRADQSGASGWIAPDGTFYACGYCGHDRCAQHVIGISAARAERLGFVRCHDDEHGTAWSNGVHGPVERTATREQKRTLRARGLL